MEYEEQCSEKMEMEMEMVYIKKKPPHSIRHGDLKRQKPKNILVDPDHSKQS